MKQSVDGEAFVGFFPILFPVIPSPASSMHFPDIVKSVLGIPGEKKVVIGIAIGTPHPNAPASLFRSSRVPVEEILRFA